jgi:DNA-binding winged helix-turn-helix (wHTH) protein/Tol biopolymer transport system component
MQRASNPLNDTSEPRLLALRFGPFELDVRSGELRRNGTTVRLQPQPLKVLLLLAGRPGDVVTREEIQAEIWPAGTFVDFEQSLNFCIRQIRAALRDDANAPRYVETLPRRGYRWVAGPVQSETSGAVVREWPRPIATDASGAQPAVDASSGAVTAALPAAAPGARPGGSLALVLVALAGLLAVAFVLWRQRPAEPTSAPTFHRITFRRGALNSARFAPDGQVVYSAAWDGAPRELQVTRSDGRDSRTLDIKEAMVVGVSSSGEVAFLRAGVLARAPLAGGPAKEVLKDIGAADWTADGRDFAVTRWEAVRTKIEFPAGRVLAETPARLGRIRISPDGRYVAYTEHPVLNDDRGLVVVVDRDGRRVAASPEWGSLDGIAWAPSGREVYFTASEAGADNSLRSLSLDGTVRMVLSGSGRFVLHDTAPDGRVLLERASFRSEIVFRRAAEHEDRDLSWLDFSAVVGISPKGDRVLFYESGEGGGPEYATFLRKTDGSPPVRLGAGRALDLSPDGRFVMSVDIRNASGLDLTPTGPGEIRHVRIPGIVAHEDAGFLADSTRIFVTGRDAAGKRATWLTDVQGREPRLLPLPDGRILRQNTFSQDGSHFVASCPEDAGYGGSCFYDTALGKPTPVPGAQKQWIAISVDAQGRLYYRDRAADKAESLLRLEPKTGKATTLAELAPRDRAGVFGVLDVNVAADGEAWAYTFQRRLSDLHIVTGFK